MGSSDILLENWEKGMFRSENYVWMFFSMFFFFRGDTTVILGSFLGTHLASWCNFQLGILKGPPLPPPYPILWPNYEQYGKNDFKVINILEFYPLLLSMRSLKNAQF